MSEPAWMNSMETSRSCRYVKDLGGNATREHFIADWEPIGADLLDHLIANGMVEITPENTLTITDLGKAHAQH